MMWNIFWNNPNTNTMEVRNVFELSVRFNRELDTIRNRTYTSLEDFSLDLRHAAQYAFWSRCEYEILLCPWPYYPEQDTERKIDVFDQLILNWDLFASYTFENLWGANYEQEEEEEANQPLGRNS